MNIKDLTFSFKDKPIFSDVKMSFEKGKITGVVGKNGIGKTTFFRVLKGIYRQQSGTVLFEEKNVSKKDLGYLPTDPFFYPFMKGREYLQLVLGKEANLDHLATLFELPLDELVQNYSTGMKKKLAFAGLLGQGKPIMILDEPFSGVDLQSNVVLKKLLLAQKSEKTILVSSHTLESMLDLCDQIYYIDEGFQYELYEREAYQNLEEKLSERIDEKISSYNKSLEKA